MEKDYWFWADIRAILLDRDKCCIYCRKELNKRTAKIDHMIPKCKGGPDTLNNLALSCLSCNNKKADMLPLDFVQVMINESLTPVEIY